MNPPLRLAELMAALAIASDLGMGQPLEFALASCIAAMRLGEYVGLGDGELRATYYQALLRYIGCNAETYLLASVYGDELAFRTNVIHADATRPAALMLALRAIRQANHDANSLAVLQAMVGGMARFTQFQHDYFAGHCEVAQRLAERLEFEAPIITALSQVYARWDGKGIPALKGEAIAPSLLVVSLAQDAVFFSRLGGAEAAAHMAQERKGTMYAPKQVELFVQHAATILEGTAEPLLADVLALEPGERVTMDDARFERACQALADYTDIKSPWLLGHSPGVARLAADAAEGAGFPVDDVTSVRRAALLHDIGRVGVSTGIWDKAGALTEREWEHVRLHPYYTERILARPVALAQLGALASLHHERLDGSGYQRGVSASQLPPAARILAAADVYDAMTHARPHRVAFAPEYTAEEMQREVKAGRLDADAVQNVLRAAGQRGLVVHLKRVAGLSEREIQVLRLLARGQSMQQIAAALVISKKTVDSHIQHIYNKIGVSTRAGAALFAVENELL